MQWFIMAIAATLFVSFICSMMEAVILSTTVTEVEALKRDHPKAGLLLEKLRFGMDETISAILTLNTIAGALGSAMIGALGTHLFSERILALIMAGFGVTLL